MGYVYDPDGTEGIMYGVERASLGVTLRTASLNGADRRKFTHIYGKGDVCLWLLC